MTLSVPPERGNQNWTDAMMRRREFLSVTAASLSGRLLLGSRLMGAAPAGTATGRIAWRRHEGSGLFGQVEADGRALVRGPSAGLLDGYCRPSGGEEGKEVALGVGRPTAACGPVQIALAHRLLAAGNSAENVLEGSLALHNPSDRPQTVEVGFATAARPCPRAAEQWVDVPISAGGIGHDPRLAELGSRQWSADCRQAVGADGFVCHYLEPSGSDPRRTATPALLLAPVVDVLHPDEPWRVAIFTTSLLPARFEAVSGEGRDAWRMGHLVRLEPGERRTIRGYLMVHRGDAAEAWAAFHQFAHHEDFAPVDWLRQIRVHYFDFLSAATPKGRRGDGFDADLPLFGEFHVGLATQHGYYPAYGDYLHPDRKEWQAMPSDPAGPVTMTIEKLKSRVAATRRAGAHPAVYLHAAILDEGSPVFARLKDSVVLDAAGRQVDFVWQGPDTIKKGWKMSVASPAWREHLLQQARWIMELLGPDAIVMDETFAAIGYDHRPGRQGPLGPHGIELMRKMRALVRSFGPQKAFITSDCSMSGMVMWADGEAGDHAYRSLLGHPLYRKAPVRYLAALGSKPWRPCAWSFQRFWPAQMELARAVGAGVGVSNGWTEYTGLARLPAAVRRKMVRDIESL
jgi:hypothetical protein